MGFTDVAGQPVPPHLFQVMPVAVGKEDIRFEECLDTVIAFELTTFVNLKGENNIRREVKSTIINTKKLLYRSCARGGLPNVKGAQNTKLINAIPVIRVAHYLG